jgi:hypothetical protein
VAALLCASAAGVASADDVRETRAEMLFRVGTQKLDAGDIDPACDALAESLRLDGKLGTLLNLALCHEKQGKPASAWLEYVTGAAWAAAAGRTDRRDFAHQHASDLERSMSRVQLDLSLVPHAAVEIDGDALPESQYSLPVLLDPGPHVLIVRAPGKRSYQTFLIGAAPPASGQAAPPTQTVVVPALADAPDATAALPAGAPVRPAHGWGARRITGVVVAAAGLAGLGVGTYFGVDSISTLGDIGAHCHGTTCDAQGVSLHGQAQTSETVSLVSLGAGAVALGVGSWLWFSPRLRLTPTLIVEPVVGAHAGAMTVVGAW